MAAMTARVNLVRDYKKSTPCKGLQQKSTELTAEVDPVALPMSRAPCKGTTTAQQTFYYIST